MTCPNLTEDGQPCGDEGVLCDKCFAAAMREHAYLRDVPRYLVIDDEQSRQEFEQEMRDAGRWVELP